MVLSSFRRVLKLFKMPPVAKQKVARNHKESLESVCAACWRKSKSLRSVSERFSEYLCKFIFEGYSKTNGYHPTVICCSCQKALSTFANSTESSGCKLPPTPPYIELAPLGPATRSSADIPCPCKICVIARMKNSDYVAHAKTQSNPIGRPSLKVSPPPKTLPICSKCYGLVTRGVIHTCTKTSKVENLSEFVKSSSAKSKSKVTSSALKSVCEDSGVSTAGGSLSLKTGGSSLPVKVGTSRYHPKTVFFSHDKLKRLQSAYNWSDNTTKKVAGAFRVIAGRKSVESNLSEALVKRNHELDHFFTVKEFVMHSKKNEQNDETVHDDSEETTVGVFCNNCDNLLQYVMSERGLNPHDCLVKVGFDGGQGILKIGFTISEKTSV